MAGRRELGFPKQNTGGNLKDQLVRATLRNVRSQGHPYVELREDGKKLIFFCTLCLAPCYGDSTLYNHLNGNLHNERLATAKSTLLKPNPWPFNDGVFFFHDDSEKESKNLPGSGSERIKLLDAHLGDEDNLAIVSYGENNLAGNDNSQDTEDRVNRDEPTDDSNLDSDGTVSELVIPAVLQNDEVSDLVAKHMGVGMIAARFSEKDEASTEIHKIWCEWLGSKDSTSEDNANAVVPDHDFAVVTLPYNYNLGRKGLIDVFKLCLPSSPYSEDNASKKRKSFSDSEDVSVTLNNQYDSSEEESRCSSNSNSKIMLAGNDDQQVLSRILLSKTMRKKLRVQQRIASERSCDICQQKMLPDKDVAALLNRKTGKLVCSSRNFTGAFHVFHISCLLHWILLREVEIYAKQSAEPKVKRRSRRNVTGRDINEMQETGTQCYSAFCPECQGTGIAIDGEQLEIPTVALAEIYKSKIKLCDAHKAWMKKPEVLQNCSMGLSFPLHSGEMYEEHVASLKLLHFYRARID